MCYGCNKALRPDNEVPPAPLNVVVCGYEYQTYNNKVTGGLDTSFKKQDCPFHFRHTCVSMKHANFDARSLHITEQDKAKLTQAHRRQLVRDFGMADI